MNRNSHLKSPVTGLLIISTAVLFCTWALTVSTSGGVNSRVLPSVTQADDVQIHARVNGCTLEIVALPEKRIPAVNNWSTDLDVSIYNDINQQVANFSVTTTNQGYSITNLCAYGIFPDAGNYDYYIIGASHLRRAFTDQSSFNYFNTFFNFSSGGKFLLAGETSNAYDNYINSLDLSTQINTYGSPNIHNDLNRDGVVNALDLSITVYNFYQNGE